MVEAVGPASAWERSSTVRSSSAMVMAPLYPIPGETPEPLLRSPSRAVRERRGPIDDGHVSQPNRPQRTRIDRLVDRRSRYTDEVCCLRSADHRGVGRSRCPPAGILRGENEALLDAG